MLLGPQIGKYLQACDWYWPYVVGSIIMVLNFFYVLYFLPDSAPERRAKPVGKQVCFAK